MSQEPLLILNHWIYKFQTLQLVYEDDTVLSLQSYLQKGLQSFITWTITSTNLNKLIFKKTELLCMNLEHLRRYVISLYLGSDMISGFLQ